MEKQQSGASAPKQSLVRLTKALIDQQPNINALMEVEQVQNQWVQAYRKTTGKEDGLLKLESEKLLFLQAYSASKDLQQCTNFSVYAAFTELLATDSTLRDGECYIIPYGKVATFQPGWKDRLKKINQNEKVVHCPEPILIREGDEYKITAGEKLIVHHIPKLNSHGEILAVYIPIQMEHGTEFILMNRDEIISIRDRYSKPYQAYIKALQSDANKGRKVGDKLIIKYKKDSEWKEFESDPPTWVTDEAQMFKKTVVKRAYNNIPKSATQKYLDDLIAKRERVDVDELNNKSQADAMNQATESEGNPIEQAMNIPDGDYVDCEAVEETGNIEQVLADKDTPTQPQQPTPPSTGLGAGLDD